MQEFKIIRLVNGGETIVDPDVYEWASKERWFRSGGGYAYRQGWKDGKHWTVWLHRQVNQTPPHLFTDHKNQHKLDNRRSNLRTVNKAFNSANRPKTQWNRSSSGFKGVSFHSASKLWRARVNDGKWTKTTYHKTEEQAALDYNRMASERFGEHADLNLLPNDITPTSVRKKSSQYRGVSFHKKTARWRAALEKDGKAIHLGAFQTEIEAARCYNDGAREYFGDRAKLNQLELMPKDYFSDTEAPERPMEENMEGGDENTFLAPKDAFGGKELKVGNKCEVEIKGILEDEVELAYVPHKSDSKEEKSEDDDTERDMKELESAEA